MKFRLYSKQLQSYVAPEEYFINGNGDVFFFDIMDGGLIKAPKGSFIIQRGTKNHDVNGLHIYEGDRVRSVKNANSSTILSEAFKEDDLERKDSYIKYLNEGFKVCGDGKGHVELYLYYCCDEDPWGLEVIGNIFDKDWIEKP